MSYTDLFSAVSGDLLTTLILAIIAYVFQRKIKSLFSANDLLTKEQVPHVKYDFIHQIQSAPESISSFTFTLENDGQTSIGSFRIFSYTFLKDEIEIIPLKISETYSWANHACGERLQLSCRTKKDRFKDRFLDFSDRENGIIIEFTDAQGTIFTQRIYVCLDLSGQFLEASPQGVTRSKKRISRRKIKKTSDVLHKKYGLHFSRG